MAIPDKVLNLLRRGKPIAAEITASRPEFRAFVMVIPQVPNLDAVLAEIRGEIQMNKSKIFSFLVLIAAFWFANLTINAQQPEQVDVVFFTTYHSRDNLSGTDFTLTVSSSNGFTTYGGRGGYSLPVFNCIPCSIPNTFSSDGFSVGFSGFNWGFDKYLRFYVTEVESDPIVLYSIIPRIRRNIAVSGTIRLRGRIEIRDQSNIITAIDNDVVLEGRYNANFVRPVYNSGVVEFTRISYALNQPLE